MINNSFSSISSLTRNSNILLIGTIPKVLNTVIDKYFLKKECITFNKESIDILNENLYHQFDIILFFLNKEKFEILQDNIFSFPEHSMLIIEDELFMSLRSSINMITSLAVLPICEEFFINKIFNVLSIKETSKILKSKEKILNKHKQYEVTNDINEFLDKYNGSIMFLNDDLNENFKRLKDLEISSELFNEIASNMLKLGTIFKQNENFSHWSSIVIALGDFLSTLDLENIDPSSYAAFDYLTTIVEDITIYLDELCLYRLFKDVRLFEDSLANNITFFEDCLVSKLDENNDNLEFF
ncbi:MAG: hypothetical protein COA66_07590 [Arcobacter sp.]|nr:MAG: hypothetical protein COA66_07590 [Arcobacter sp.]